MSEYQYYEFLAIDRPLTAEETSKTSISSIILDKDIYLKNVYIMGNL